MLPKPIIAQFKFGNPIQRINFTLDRVLVIRRLPIPLHISIKRIVSDNNDKWSEGITCFINFMSSPGEMPQSGMVFTKKNMPLPFQSHQYWGENTINFLGMTADYDERRSYLINASAGSQDCSAVQQCLHCGSTEQLLKCSRCKAGIMILLLSHF